MHTLLRYVPLNPSIHLKNDFLFHLLQIIVFLAETQGCIDDRYIYFCLSLSHSAAEEKRCVILLPRFS